MPKLTSANLADPVHSRQIGRGVGAMNPIGPLVVGRAQLQPGWRWSEDLRPIVGTESCMVHHLQVLLAGRLAVRMDDGEEAVFGPLDTFEILPGHDTWVVGDEPVDILDISGNVEDFGLPATTSRAVATLLMSDIVDSTLNLARTGDKVWRQTLADHDRVVRMELRRGQGREIATTGDGFLAEFSSAGAALGCALRVRDAVRGLGIEVRVGVHTGEIERAGEDVRGLTVHATARVMSAAGASEVLTTMITRLLCAAGPFVFEDRGQHQLKGLPAPLELFGVRQAGDGRQP
ncbi:MAG TPA: adenylate/guanylate cyclase domain-containing protein [Candidatus Limnocylindrales bacterium]|nr:adenylate/guanylate cyclase domain-containing protein [Candidatus Limnocylindrales bacterium]